MISEVVSVHELIEGMLIEATRLAERLPSVATGRNDSITSVRRKV